jgi:hypothetical protein
MEQPRTVTMRGNLPPAAHGAAKDSDYEKGEGHLPPAAHGAAKDSDYEKGQDAPTDDQPGPVREADTQHLHTLK